MAENFEIIQEFLSKVNPVDSKVREMFGLTERNFELFWAALNAADENLEIGDLTKVVKKALSTKYPSTYINSVAKSNLIKRGDKMGSWRIAAPAINKIKAIISGEVAAEGAGDVGVRKTHKTSKKPNRHSSRKQVSIPNHRLSARIAKKTVGDLIAKLHARESEIVAEIKRLEAERKEIPTKIREVVELFS